MNFQRIAIALQKPTMATAGELVEEALRRKRLTVVGRICISGFGVGGNIGQFIWERVNRIDRLKKWENFPA